MIFEGVRMLSAGCGALGTAFAGFALIRRWRDTFPTRGKAVFGGS